MVRTRNSVRKSSKTPIKKKATPKIATKKVDRQKIERCKQWLTQQKWEKGRSQSSPIDTLESDASADEDELCVLRLSEAALVSWPTRNCPCARVCVISKCSSSSFCLQNPLPANERKAKIYFVCEWQKCNKLVDSYVELQTHVKHHLNQIEDDGNSYECEWDLCMHETNDVTNYRRHVLYHVYMTNLKTLGEQLLLKKEPLPACIIDSRRRNLIPDTDTKYVCQWRDCRYAFEFIQDYFDHARCHCVHEVETHRENNRNQTVQCLWINCQKQFTKQYKMVEHLRTHTGERVVACANCGSTFNSYVKFYDHFKRQSVNSKRTIFTPLIAIRSCV